MAGRFGLRILIRDVVEQPLVQRVRFVTGRRTPILIYQMGKVGSTSIFQQLSKSHTHRPIHVHRMHPDTLRAVEALNQKQLGFMPQKERRDRRTSLGLLPLLRPSESSFWAKAARRRGFQVITLVREPVARAVSAFFQTLGRHQDLVASIENGTLDVDGMVDQFWKQHQPTFQVNWFEQEFQPVTGVDVYGTPFDTARGFKVCTSGSVRVFVTRQESLHDETAAGLADFLGLPSFSLAHENRGDAKWYQNLYSQVKNRIAPSAPYLLNQYNSRMMQHFYSREERTEFMKRWGQGASADRLL